MRTVLLVEDEANQRLLYRMELEEDGFHVLEAANGLQALRQVTTAHPDIVVLDLRLPGLDGMSTLAKLKEINARLPVVVYSAFDMHRDDPGASAADGIKSPSLYSAVIFNSSWIGLTTILDRRKIPTRARTIVSKRI